MLAFPTVKKFEAISRSRQIIHTNQQTSNEDILKTGQFGQFSNNEEPLLEVDLPMDDFPEVELDIENYINNEFDIDMGKKELADDEEIIFINEKIGYIQGDQHQDISIQPTSDEDIRETEQFGQLLDNEEPLPEVEFYVENYTINQFDIEMNGEEYSMEPNTPDLTNIDSITPRVLRSEHSSQENATLLAILALKIFKELFEIYDFFHEENANIVYQNEQAENIRGDTFIHSTSNENITEQFGQLRNDEELFEFHMDNNANDFGIDLEREEYGGDEILEMANGQTEDILKTGQFEQILNNA